ncbi:MAG: mono/diheme cytochrome c family protein [Bacteriovoracaceae bacterium]|jgi:mono/diheme cytochrome c family protein
MNKIFLLIAINVFLISCYQEVNSNSFDDRFSKSNGVDTSTAAGQRLSDAYDVMKNNCMNCHTGYHNNWSSLNTDQKWIGEGVIEVGETYSSTLLVRLKNIGGNMPKDNPQISEEDFDKIVDWIDNI